MKNRLSDEKLRIAMFGHKRIPSREGGIEVVVEELATRMAIKRNQVTCFNRRGHHVSGSQFDNYNLSEYKGVKIKKAFTIDKKGLAAATSSFSAAIKTAFGPYDIVHIHAEGPAAMCFIPKIFRKKVIVTIHGLDWARSKWGGFATHYIKWGEKQAARFADEIIVLSLKDQKYFEEKYNRKTNYIPNGVNKPELRNVDEIAKIWGLEKDDYVLFLGRIVPEKGIEDLLKAWKKIETEKKLVIVGGESDSKSFMEEMKALGDDRVIFTGFQQGIILEELLSNAYIFVLPSEIEGMPLSLLEAMSFGNCCVVSDIAECIEVVEDNAIIFPCKNIDILSETINRLFRNKAEVEKYKSIASSFICNKYNWDEVTEKTLQLYKKE